MLRTLTLATAFFASTATADIAVRFVEGAPKDRFQIMNLSACALGPIDVVIDLSQSASGLIFDTTATGEGVEVFQPFELVDGAENVLATSRINDGDNVAQLSLSDLPADGVVAFTIDVDDTLTNSNLGQIRVAGNEISGAEFRIVQAGSPLLAAQFDDRGRAVASFDHCQS